MARACTKQRSRSHWDVLMTPFLQDRWVLRAAFRPRGAVCSVGLAFQRSSFVKGKQIKSRTKFLVKMLKRWRGRKQLALNSSKSPPSYLKEWFIRWYGNLDLKKRTSGTSMSLQSWKCNLRCLALRIQKLPDRRGLMVETSHPYNRIIGVIPFLGHTNGSLGL